MDVDEICTAKNSILSVIEIKNKLIKILQERLEPEEDIYTLAINDDNISINFMNVIAQSTPRIVKLSDSSFAHEFLFSVGLQQDLDVEVFRFYLTNNGKLYEDMNMCIPLGDFNEVNAIKSIMFKIVSGVLKSDFYLPSVVLDK